MFQILRIKEQGLTKVSCDSCKTIWEHYCELCKKKPKLPSYRPPEDFSDFVAPKGKKQLILAGKIPKYRPNGKKRDRIKKRDGNKCLKCGTKKSLTIDHIVPRAKGGSNDEDNLQTLCRTCNLEKGEKIIDYRCQ